MATTMLRPGEGLSLSAYPSEEGMTVSMYDGNNSLLLELDGKQFEALRHLLQDFAFSGRAQTARVVELVEEVA